MCPGGFREVQVYAWTDASGEILFETVRFEHQTEQQGHKPGKARKTFKFRQPFPSQPGLYLPSRGDAPLVVFRKDRLAAHPGADLHWAEGEDQVLALEDLGYLSTTTAGGAKGIHAYDPDELRQAAHGRNVVLHADADPDGEAYVAFLARTIAPVARSVRIVRYAECGPGGDVLDWIHGGGTREELARLATQAPAWKADVSQSEDSADFEGDSAPWNAPIPLPEGERPEFPVALLPDPLATFVAALSLATQTPTALVALMVLGAIAIAAAKRVSVQVRPGWIEPANLFLLLNLGSGNRKSAVVAAVGRPLRAFEAAQAEAMQVEIAQAQARRQVAEKRLDRLQKRLASEDDRDASLTLEAELRELVDGLANDPSLQIPVAPRLLVDDVTPEKLAALMADHGGRMGVLSAEGGIFQTIAGRYSEKRTDSLDLFLKGHAGDDMPIDRIGRPTKHLHAPALTLALAVQPEVVTGLAAQPGFRGRGLLARFAYACPTSTVGRRQIAPPAVPSAVEQTYADLITGVLSLPNGEEPLTLTAAATAAFMTFERDLEPRLGIDGDLEHLADWGSKLAGLVGRITGLFHVVECVADKRNPWSREISAPTIRAAIEIAEGFLLPHAKTAFALMGADPSVEQARRLLRVIRTWPEETVSRRDLHQRLRASFPKPEELDRPLALLVEHGYLRRVMQQITGPGRRPSGLFAINPLGRPQNTHIPHNTPDPSHSEDCVHSEYGIENENGHALRDAGDRWAGAARVRI
jgi:hypothetical protein